MDYFTLFNLPVDYQIDVHSLVPRYQELQRQFHPDRFATASENEKLQALQQTATVNEAYQTLKHPLRRAEYLLSLHDIDVQNEQHTMHDTAFLMEQLELREELDLLSKRIKQEPVESEDRLLAFSGRVAKMVKQRSEKLVQALAEQQWQAAADTVRKLRFLDKLQQQIERIEEQLFEA